MTEKGTEPIVQLIFDYLNYLPIIIINKWRCQDNVLKFIFKLMDSLINFHLEKLHKLCLFFPELFFKPESLVPQCYDTEYAKCYRRNEYGDKENHQEFLLSSYRYFQALEHYTQGMLIGCHYELLINGLTFKLF